jgi:nucleoside-diphosphate-sugar epimerase
MDKKTEKILVTGATGFVGSYLLRELLAAGYQNLVAMRRTTSRMDLVSDIQHQVSWAEGDILDVFFIEETIEKHKISTIIHAAAMVSFDARDREEMYKINIEGTANLVNMALENSVKKFIHVSSTAAIGRPTNQKTISEQTKWERSPLNTHYAISKYQGEQEVWRGGAEGLSIAIVNPSVILGGQFWNQGTGRMFQQVEKGLRFYTEGVTGFVDVRDVAVFLRKLVENDVSEQRFILSSENISYKMVFENIAKVLGKRAPNIAVNRFLAALAWRVEWFKSIFTGSRPLITRETAQTSAKQYFYDNQKSLQIFADFHYRNVLQSVDEIAKIFNESKQAKRDFGILK